jgi:hypothetical protein
MTLEQATNRRNLLGKLAAALGLLMFLAMLDGLVARFREPANVFKVLPGETVEINGPLVEEIKDLRELTYQASSSHLAVRFVALHKGYFLGGDMWRGELRANGKITPGEYELRVLTPGGAGLKPLPPFRIMVFFDKETRQRRAPSLVLRFTGTSPWAAALAILPLALAVGGGVFLMSQRIETLLAQQGKAEIYRVLRRDDGLEIHFGLGMAHGLRPGDRVAVRDGQGRQVAGAEVQETRETSAWALVPGDREVKEGYIVTRVQT